MTTLTSLIYAIPHIADFLLDKLVPTVRAQAATESCWYNTQRTCLGGPCGSCGGSYWWEYVYFCCTGAGCALDSAYVVGCCCHYGPTK